MAYRRTSWDCLWNVHVGFGEMIYASPCFSGEVRVVGVAVAALVVAVDAGVVSHKLVVGYVFAAVGTFVNPQTKRHCLSHNLLLVVTFLEHKLKVDLGHRAALGYDACLLKPRWRILTWLCYLTHLLYLDQD